MWIIVAVLVGLVLLAVVGVAGVLVYRAMFLPGPPPATVESTLPHAATETPAAPAEAVVTPQTTDTAASEQAPATPTVTQPPVSVRSEVAVPNVLGINSAKAEQVLADVGGFNIIYNSSRYSERYAKGSIMSQSPAAGTIAHPGDAVYLAQSLGPNPTPPPRPQVTRPKPPRVTGGAGELAPFTRSRRVGDADLQYWSNWQLTLIRNEIYARHGRPFNNSNIRSWFMQQSWYAPNYNFSESWLSSLEKRNAAYIASYQKRVFGASATGP